MTKTKILTALYFLILFIGTILLFNISIDINLTLESFSPLNNIDISYTELQTKVSMYSVTIFVILLLISYSLYYLTNKRNYIIISNILYISITLYIYVTINRQFFEVQKIEYSQQGEYWITVFMGVFYAIGAILVSIIGYITIRNYTKRSTNLLVKSNRNYHIHT